MQGFQISFFMEQNTRQEKQLLSEWLLELAQACGISGATVFIGTSGFGKSHRIHSAHFFELMDQPVEVTMIVSNEESENLFSILKEKKIDLFYVKTPVEFGRLGK